MSYLNLSKFFLLCVKINFLIKKTILYFTLWPLFNKIHSKSIKHIVIFRTGSLGDSICTFPALDAIRQHYPESEITLLTNSGSQNYVSLGQLIHPKLYDKIIDYTSLNKSDVIKVLRSNKYDLFIELTQAHATLFTCIRNAIAVRLCGIRYAFGWQISVSRLFKKTQAKYQKFIPETIRFLNMLEQNGIKKPEKLNYYLNITSADRKLVTELLKSHGINDTSCNMAAIVIGAKRGANRWPIEYFTEIINYLQRREFKIVIIGGASDKKLIDGLTFNSKIFDFTGSLTPLQSAALLEKCKFTISNDTGPMHLSYAVGTKVLAIFSNRDYPTLWYPPKKDNIVLRATNIPCTICLKETCPINNFCLKEIKPEKVIAEIRAWIN